jgi:hypothetical protein
MKLEIKKKEDSQYDVFVDDKWCMTCDYDSAYAIKLFIISLCAVQHKYYTIITDL